MYITLQIILTSVMIIITGASRISLCTDIAHEKKITDLPQIWILTMSLLNLTSPNFCIQAYTREYAAHQEN